MSPETRRSIGRHLLAGLVGGTALFIGLGSWAGLTEISGAVVASGYLVVENDVKKIAHLSGGIVSELRVRNGDSVEPGDVLARLDGTVVAANRAIVSKAYDEAVLRKARLETERDGKPDLALPEDIVAREREPGIPALIATERNVLATRRQSRDGQKSQLRERIDQLGEQVTGLTEQIGAKKRETQLIEQELVGVRELWTKKLIPVQRVNALDRELARLEGEKGGLVATLAQTKGKISETNLQIMQIDQDVMTDVNKDLAELNGKISEYFERRTMADDQLKRLDLRASEAGTVHKLAIHTIGGVIAANETVMEIVPSADQLRIEVKILPREINQVYRGQTAAVRFPALDQRTTPDLEGRVTTVSADQIVDQKTGQPYYSARISVSAAEFARLGEVSFMPGMPADVFVRTEPRTVLAYLTKPLVDQLSLAFRGK